MKLDETPEWVKGLPADGRVETRHGPARVHTQSVGALRLPSGRLVACDPALVDSPALERRVPAGDYPVTTVTIDPERRDDTRVAAAWIDFAPGAISSWEPAVREGARDRSRRGGGAHGLGVDSATASFMSAEALEQLTGPRASQLAQALADADREERSPTCWWRLAQLPGTEGLNIALCSSGDGDGLYPVFWGLNDARLPVRLVADFLLIAPRPPTSDIRASPWWRVWR